MLHVVITGTYYPPVITTWQILTTGASYLTTGALCSVTINMIILKGYETGKRKDYYCFISI